MYAVLKSLSVQTVTAGTAVPLAASKLTAYGVRIKAPAANTGKVYLGDVSLVAPAGYELAAGELISLDDLVPFGEKAVPLDLSQVYVDSAVDAEGVTVLYLESSQG
jgi:hypothetical protein